MFELKFNKDKITKQELSEIEKRFNEYLRNNKKSTPEFNVLDLSRTDLYAHVLCIFLRLNIHQLLEINVSQMLDFLIDVAEKYTDEAPYHTFYHAADIVTMLYYLCHDLNADKYLTNLDIAFLMVSALCHDAGHPGLNNAFQMNTKTDLAEKYGGKSVLETYSVDLTLELIKKHEIKQTDDKIITDLILSTDMAYHNELEQQAKRLNANTLNSSSKEDRISLCRILLHAADISNMARPWMISKQWSDLIVQEFFNQGDEEKKRNITVSPGMDREVCSQRNISLKFGEIILPFFQSLVTLLPKSHVLVDFLAANRVQWECLDQTNKKRQIRRVSSDIPQQSPKDTTVITTTLAPTTYKRIRLGFRSQSYPTVFYQQHSTRNNRTLSRCNINTNHLEKSHHYSNNNSLLLTTPLVTFKSASLYEKPNNIETIVLYHPYDQ